MNPEIESRATVLLEAYRVRGLMLATAESCTGGLIAASLTDIAGSSDVVERGFVTYSNAAKHEILGVPEALIADHGAVSAQVAEAMASGALDHARADVAVSVTGIAGPGGASGDKPVGLVFLGLARRGEAVTSERRVFPGDRRQVREASVLEAFALLQSAVEA